MSMGFLRSCMDRRFVAATRKAFEEKSGLGPTDYWHEAYAGGSAIAWHEAYADGAPIQANEDLGVKYVLEHAEKEKVTAIFGWQAHLNGCGGQPKVSDVEIAKRLNRQILAMMASYPQARHFRILASEAGIDVQEMTPMVVTLQADTGKYLSRINRGQGLDPIEAAKSVPDSFCQFTVTTLGNGQVTVQADTGKYLSRINRGQGLDPIEAAKSVPDSFCQFTVTSLGNGRVTLQADTGKYLSRINRGQGLDPIEATKSVSDSFCQFTVSVLAK